MTSRTPMNTVGDAKASGRSRRRWNRAAAVLLVVGMAAACSGRPVVIFAVSTINRDVLIRIESDTSTRTWLLRSLTARDLEYRSAPYESATVAIFDPTSCERLWKTRLPRASTTIEIAQGDEPGVQFSDKIRVVVGPDALDPDPPVLEESDLCS